MLRRGDTVWIERIMPPGVHSEAAHAKAKQPGGKDHKHLDLGSASRWIQKTADDKLRFRLVSEDDKVVVDIAPAEYATVGFDGSWLAAYHLIDPAVLSKLSPHSAAGSRHWYQPPESKNANVVKILWETKLEIPLQVQTKSADGLSKRSTVVRVLSNESTAPWQSATKYATKDYSDFLD